MHNSFDFNIEDTLENSLIDNVVFSKIINSQKGLYILKSEINAVQK